MAEHRRVRRARRWVMRALIASVVICVTVLGTASFVETGGPRSREVAATPADPVMPHRVARATHLDSAYVAPPGATSTALGRVRIGRLGVDAPVTPVGWDGDTMAVPNDPGALGWFEPSARLDDLAGTSLIAGHVSDASDRPGPLAALVRSRAGDIVEWRGSGGHAIRFRVVSIQRFPRAAGLPASLFRVDGPHVLRLVTCTNRVASASGFHYTDNLVVSAVAVGA
ncbi:MAG: class F sortase [Marmoricola sp.]